ncbi:MAG: DUF354 domain-containing protein [Thermodesulfovibrionales bacterium]|nr:DUF354 domain-containing protein [Thermodesulfovibrionales bacterium]
MRILIDICHPAHVHLYRNFIKEMEDLGHQFWITVKNVASSKKLLQFYNIPFIQIGDKKDSLIGKGLSQFRYNWILQKLVRKNKITVGMGSSITVAHVSKLTKMYSVVFDEDDDQVEPLFTYCAHPFSDYLLSPDVLRNKRRKKNTIYYSGYHELASLHPKRFVLDSQVMREIGMQPGEMFFILRFNVFKAYHDHGVSGLSLQDKRRLIARLSEKGKVFITMERELQPEFEKYRLRISSEKIHSLIYYATMLIGDSQTMTSEAAVLGTPALKCNSFAGKLAVPNELENKYQLCYSFQPTEVDSLFEKMEELLAKKDLKMIWQKRRSRMLQDKIDVTSFMVWFVDSFPKSAEIMRNDPEYQLRFK